MDEINREKSKRTREKMWVTKRDILNGGVRLNVAGIGAVVSLVAVLQLCHGGSS